MFFSAVWTLILTAPIHCRGSLVSKWWNATFLQICSDEERISSTSRWPESEDIFSRFKFLGDFFNVIQKYPWNIIHTKVQILLPITGSFQAPWSSLGACGEQYCLKWESRYLLDLGSILDSLWDGLVSVVAQEALKYTILSGMSAWLMQGKCTIQKIDLLVWGQQKISCALSYVVYVSVELCSHINSLCLKPSLNWAIFDSRLSSDLSNTSEASLIVELKCLFHLFMCFIIN